jgi:hypothetical protein
MRFAVAAAPHHPRTAIEDQRYEEAFQHCGDYCCARVCRACLGTAYGPEPDCEHRHRPGCFSSRGFGPSSPLHDLNEESAGLPGAAPYPQPLALVRLLEVMALIDEAACDELMLRAPEVPDEEFRALIAKWRQECPSRRFNE